MSFSDNLYHLRTARNMTQEQLAMLLGVSRQAISKWEARRAYPEMDKLVRLCAVFECGLDELVNGDVPGLQAPAALSIPAGQEAVDACGYDRHMRRRALLLALAPTVALLALAIFFGTGGFLAPVFSGGETLATFLLGQPVQTLVLAMGLLLALGMLIAGIVGHMRFRAAYPCVEDFYRERSRADADELVKRARIAAPTALAIGVVACAVKCGPLCHVNGGLASLLAFSAAAVFVGGYAFCMKRRLDIAAYNERNAMMLEGRVAAQASPAPVRPAAGGASRELELAYGWIRRQTAIVCACVLSAFALIAALFAALGWIIWFIPALVGIAAAVLVWVFLPYAWQQV